MKAEELNKNQRFSPKTTYIAACIPKGTRIDDIALTCQLVEAMVFALSKQERTFFRHIPVTIGGGTGQPHIVGSPPKEKKNG